MLKENSRFLKLVSFVLVLLFALSVLASCGEKENQTATKAPTTIAPTAKNVTPVARRNPRRSYI